MDYYRFDAAAILLILSVLYSLIRIKSIKTNTLKAFIVLLYLCLGTSTFDLISELMFQNPMKYSYFLLYLVKTIYQIIYHSIPITYFFCTYFAIEDNRYPPKKTGLLYGIPYSISITLILLNVFTKNIFYFDEQHLYHHGPFTTWLYIEASFYLIYTFVKYIKNRGHFHFSQIITLFFYTLLCAGIVIIQLISPHTRLMGFVLSLSVLLGYLSLENPANYEDKKTNIYNKNAFEAYTKSVLSSNQPLYLMKVHLTSLEYVHDFLGNESYYELLSNIADYFKTTFTKQNVFRYARHTLVLILDSNHESRNTQILELNKRFKQPFKCGHTELTVSFESHLISIPEDASDYNELINILDSPDELYSSNKPDSQANRKENAEKKQRENHIIELLDKAILQNGFEVYYQPIYNITKNKFCGAEALIRLKNSDIGVITPEEFIPIAEKNGMITRIGKIVLSEVCHFLSTYKIWQYGIEYVNVNLSSIQIMQDQFPNYYLKTLENFKLQPNYINFELIDSSSDSQNYSIRKNLDTLNESGVAFLLDAYGIGSSHIMNVSEFPFKAIKIDRKVVWSTLSDEKAKIILKETISMIKDLKISVVAEGVETHQQAIELIKMGCDYLQGFYYSDPLSTFEFLQFIK